MESVRLKGGGDGDGEGKSEIENPVLSVRSMYLTLPYLHGPSHYAELG